MDARGASCNFGWGCTVLNHAKLRTRKRKTHRRYQGSPGGNGATRGSQLANYSPCIESYVTIVVLLRSYAIVEDRCLLGKNKSLTRNGLHSMWCVVHARCKYCTVHCPIWGLGTQMSGFTLFPSSPSPAVTGPSLLKFPELLELGWALLVPALPPVG